MLEAEAITRFIIVHITAVPLGQNFENVMSCIFTVVGDVRKHFPGCYALQLNYKKRFWLVLFLVIPTVLFAWIERIRLEMVGVVAAVGR